MGAPPEWVAWDARHVWHPYAAIPESPAPLPVIDTAGVRLHLANGRELVDAMASWWCVIHGYRHPHLVRALQEQTDTVPHVMFGGLTHEPAVQLAQQLAQQIGDETARVFFCDSGSVAIEVALKMALQYWQARGEPARCRFLALRGGYHGDTFAAMSVSDPDNSLHEHFRALVPPQHFSAKPPAAGCDDEVLNAAYNRFENDLRKHRSELAAVVLEPILQGAGGFHVYDARFLRTVAELCKQHDVLLIADEIATGFGRTGEMFACMHADVRPDLMCIGKALSGGTLSLAATIARGDIAEVISHAGIFPHGPTFMANPAACRVALASLELLQSRDWRAEVTAIETLLMQELMPLQSESGVASVRVLGAFGVVEMNETVDVAVWQQHAIDHGVWIRPFQRYVYVMPPFVIQASELRQVTDMIRSGVDALQAHPEVGA